MNTVICDLDGTIADCAHRVHHLQSEPKNWDAFYAECVADPVIATTADIMEGLYRLCGYDVIIVTGRSDIVRQETEQWLNDNNIYHTLLLMRPHGDHTEDTALKLRLLEENNIPLKSIDLVLEDRTRVVEMWRSKGIRCHQVASGDF